MANRIPTIGIVLPKVLATCLAAAVLFPLHAQPQIKRFTTNDGLAQNMVRAIVIDSYGFLWFGTSDGLSRYDGYSFRNFNHEPSDSSSISAGYITTLHACPSGRLWVGFEDGRIDIYDAATELFTHLRRRAAFPSGMKNEKITAIEEDRKGVHWVSTEGDGILEITEERGSGNQIVRTVKRHHTILAGNRSLRVDTSRITFVDRSGGFWIQTSHGIIAWKSRLVPDSLILRPGPTGLADVWWGMNQDRAGTFWAVNYKYLISYEPALGVMQRFARSDTAFRPVGMLTREDDRGWMWLADNGIVRFDPRHPQVQKRYKPEELGNDVWFSSLCLDSSGNVWAGSSGEGLFRYNPDADHFGLIPGVAWRDLAESLRSPKEWKHAQDPLVPYSPLRGAFAFKDSHGVEWHEEMVSGEMILVQTDPSTNTVRRFHDGLGGRRIVLSPTRNYYVEDNAGTLWIVARSTGLNKFDRRTNRFSQYQIIRGQLTEVSELSGRAAVITAAYRDRNGIFWIGTRRHGLYRLDPVAGSMKGYANDPRDPFSMSNNHVLSLCDDPNEPDRFLWIGTDGGGLNRLEKATGHVLRITERDGLPNNVTYGILPDGNKNLWISTNFGICRLDPQSREFHLFDIQDGLQGMEFNRDEFFKAPDGEMFFGGTDGINAFYPDRIADNPHQPPVVFTDLRLHNQSVLVTDYNTPLTSSILETKELEFEYEQNVITLEFASLDFTNPGKNRYSYRLEGFEDKWSKPSMRRSATYTNLNPGEYVFRVRGSNGDGVWNMEGARIKLVILPPWYRTNAAYAVYVILAVTGLFFLRQYELKRLRLKEELRLEQVRADQLRSLDQLKMRFFQNISHEFRTPLTLILGPLETLRNAVTGDQPKSQVQMIRRNAVRLLRLINQLLDLTRIEEGQMKLKIRKKNMVPFLRGMVMSFQSLADQKNILLRLHTGEEPVVADIDPDKVEKIVVNLLSNAFKFTPSGGEITVRLSTEQRERGNGAESVCRGWIVILVKDNGPGISPKTLPHIFDRFFQVDEESRRSQEGTGIGLALVKELVELHGGEVRVASSPGEGTEFVLSIPMESERVGKSGPGETDAEEAAVPVIAESEVDALGSAESDDRGAGEEESGRAVVLVVEDNGDVRGYIQSILVPEFAVHEASDGLQGIESAREHVPDLVISDVMMPGMDGYEMCRRLKGDEETSHIPVVLLTAKALAEDKLNGLGMGADDYLVKPFEASELLVRVRNLIESRRTLREKFARELISLSPGQVAVTSVDQKFFQKVKDSVERNLGREEYGIDDLAADVGLSARQLQRKLKGVTNMTGNEFIRSLRLQRAMELLKGRVATVSEIAYSVGFGSPAYFARCFRQEFGMSPSEVATTA